MSTSPPGVDDDTEMSAAQSAPAGASASPQDSAAAAGDSQPPPPARTIHITGRDGRTYKYDYEKTHEELRRPIDIIRRLEHDYNINLQGVALASRDLPTDGGIFVREKDDIDYDEHPSLEFSLKPQPIKLWVLHCGQRQVVEASAETTIAGLRDIMADIGSYSDTVRVDEGRYCFHGSRLTDESRTLAEIGVRTGTLYRDDEEEGEFNYDSINWDSVIEGKLQLRITDPNLPQNDSTSLPAEVMIHVYSDDTLFELIEQYVKATNRTILHMDYALIPQGDTIPLDMSQPLHQQHIVDDMNLTLNTKKIKVIIKESVASGERSGFEYTDLEVHDWESVRDIKHAYNAAKAGEREPLTSADTLFFGSDVLDDHRRLFSYKIQNASEIQLQRESLVRKVAVYICASCGHDVTLKRNDQIQCLNCFDNHILYKKPTGKPRQYICR